VAQTSSRKDKTPFSAGDSPNFVFETYFLPAGKPQFAGANKDMQGERNSQPG
jgi:hypothetical protein